MKVFGRVSVSAIVVFSLGVACLGVKSFAKSQAQDSVAISRAELRDLTLAMLSDSANSQQNAAVIERLIRQYRTDANPSSPLNPLIQDGPLPAFAAADLLPGIWDGIYQSSFKSLYDSVGPHQPMEPIFDDAMTLVLSGQKIPGLESIGPCIAGAVERGKDDKTCKLNLDETSFDPPSKIDEIWAAINCGVHLESACRIRKTIFDAAKQQLIKYRDMPVKDDLKTPSTDPNDKTLLQRVVIQYFPKIMSQGILKIGNQLQTQVPQILTDKFQGKLDPLWSTGDTMETDEFGSPTISMSGFARGLSADILAAGLFSQSKDPEQLGMAAALLYAAGNRLAYLMGGPAADFANGSFVLAPKQVSGLTCSGNGQPPLFASHPFGGVGEVMGPDKQAKFADWDFSGYTASAAPTPTPQPSCVPSYEPFPAPTPASVYPPAFQIFPTAFSLEGGTPKQVAMPLQEQRLDDMAELASSMVNFLEMTAPSGPLGRYFGEINDPSQLTSATDSSGKLQPVMLPVEGRTLAVGVLASVLKNLVDLNYGHAYTDSGHTDASGKPDPQPSPGADRGGVGIAFYESVTLNGRTSEMAHVSSIAKMLEAAMGLHDVIVGPNPSPQTSPTPDPALPAAVVSAQSEVDSAIQMTALTMVAKQCQAMDGGFYEYVNHPELSPRSLMTNVEAIRALTSVYDRTYLSSSGHGEIALLQSLVSAWQFMDAFWVQNASVPKMYEGADTAHRQFAFSELWNVVRLWDQVQASHAFDDINRLQPDWETQKTWSKWQDRFEQLRRVLNSRMNGASGGLNKVDEAS
jgi:hypothetical protein